LLIFIHKSVGSRLGGRAGLLLFVVIRTRHTGPLRGFSRGLQSADRLEYWRLTCYECRRNTARHMKAR
jgi:hypothetical protein